MESLAAEQSSVFSAYLKEKILEKGWSVKEFAEKAGLNEKYAYRLVSPKRDFVPGDDILYKILKALDLPDEEGQYIVDLIFLERQVGKPVYPGHPDLPAPPGLEPVPQPQPDPPLPEPEPLPLPPEPHPPGPWWMQLPSLLLPAGMVSWIERNRKVIIIVSVVLLGLMLGGCCILSVVLAPIGL